MLNFCCCTMIWVRSMRPHRSAPALTSVREVWWAGNAHDSISSSSGCSGRKSCRDNGRRHVEYSVPSKSHAHPTPGKSQTSSVSVAHEFPPHQPRDLGFLSPQRWDAGCADPHLREVSRFRWTAARNWQPQIADFSRRHRGVPET